MSDYAKAVALLFAAAEVLRDPNVQPIEKHRVVLQIEAFLDVGPAAPVRIVHKFREGIVDGPDYPPTMKEEFAVCGKLDLAWAIVVQDLPTEGERARLPPHSICPTCFPAAPRAA